MKRLQDVDQQISLKLLNIGWETSDFDKREITFSKEHKYLLYLQNSTNNIVSKIIGLAELRHFSKIKRKVLTEAKLLGISWIFISDGETIILWDIFNDDSRYLSSFYSPNDLQRKYYLNITRKELKKLPIEDLQNLRSFHREAIEYLSDAIDKGKRSIKINMVLGTGRTFLMLKFVKMMIHAKVAQKILIIVNFVHEASQILERFKSEFPNIGCSLITSGNSSDFTGNDILITTSNKLNSSFQSLSSSSIDALIRLDADNVNLTKRNIIDGHFDALKIYFSSVLGNDEKADFNYTISDAIKDGVLAQVKFISVTDEKYYTNQHRHDDNESRFIEAEMIKKYVSLNESDRKTIVYTSSKFQAYTVTAILNEACPQHGIKYAELVTSDNNSFEVNEIVNRFRYNEFPKILVNVNMLETGIDIPEVENIVILKKLNSPAQMHQIISRGSRINEITNKDKLYIYDYFNNFEMLNDLNKAPKKSRINYLDEKESYKPKFETSLFLEIGGNSHQIRKSDYIKKWEEYIKFLSQSDPIIQGILEHKSMSHTNEDELLKTITNEYHFSEENLKNAYNMQDMNLKEFVLLAVGKLVKKSNEERFNEQIINWKKNQNFTRTQEIFIDVLKNICLKKGKINYKAFNVTIKRLAESIFIQNDLETVIREVHKIYKNEMSNDNSNIT
ncbi:helicase-related protein [Paenibacillus elgii]|uniref:helicase-related protein n=1 Tax=Paenibacillus elgii TaxID=189691 RepID=UPI0013D4C3CC|nr:helicase-related protein [Paenibacillus elgii]